VDEQAKAIVASTENATVKDIAGRFLVAHAALDAAYAAALTPFELSRGTDFKSADGAVNGRDVARCGSRSPDADLRPRRA